MQPSGYTDIILLFLGTYDLGNIILYIFSSQTENGRSSYEAYKVQLSAETISIGYNHNIVATAFKNKYILTYIYNDFLTNYSIIFEKRTYPSSGTTIDFT